MESIAPPELPGSSGPHPYRSPAVPGMASYVHSGSAVGAPDTVGGPGLVNTKQRARVTPFSLENTVEARSQRRAARCARRTIPRARLMDESIRKGGRRGRWLMVTTTYRNDVNWEPGHLRTCLHAMRQWG